MNSLVASGAARNGVVTAGPALMLARLFFRMYLEICNWLALQQDLPHYTFVSRKARKNVSQK